jgi:hypothetical protein
MKTIATNGDNDIYRGQDGNVAFVTDIVAAAETSVHYAKTLRNEMIHEYDLGVPFFIVAFGPSVNIQQFEAAMKARILQTPEVTAITSFETTQEGDVLKYTATIETTYGAATING